MGGRNVKPLWLVTQKYRRKLQITSRKAFLCFLIHFAFYLIPVYLFTEKQIVGFYMPTSRNDIGACFASPWKKMQEML